MGFNQTYNAIKVTWRENFWDQTRVRERKYVSSRMGELQTAFQNEQYQKAIATTRTLFGYFSRIADKKNHPLKKPASKIKEHFWTLEGILEKKL